MDNERNGAKSELEAEANAFGLPFFASVPSRFLEGAGKLPAAWARSHCLVACRVDGRDFLLMSSPRDIDQLERASRAAGCRFEPAIAPQSAILAALGDWTGTAEASMSMPSPEASTGLQEPVVQAIPQQEDSAAPAASFIDALVAAAIVEGASDIHFEPFPSGMSVRFRIDGTLHRRQSPPRGQEDAVVSRLKVMAGMDISERRLPQDGMAQVATGGRRMDIRVSTIPVADGERVVLRLLDRADALLPLGRLGMGGAMLDAFRSLIGCPNGIIAISGPTGSGKTTTLYAALGEIDSTRRNILTVEDPVEYRLPGVGQIQVKPKIGLTFASGLRHILRQDPDVILVGETRDSETAEIAVRASLTGHLVLTTLHTNDAPSAVVRLIDMGVAPYLVAASLRGVLSQRLVRRLCPHCRRKVAPGADYPPLPGLDGSLRSRLSGCGTFSPVGCGRCFDGYRGRIGIFELMTCGEDVARLVRSGVTDSAALREAAGNGAFPMSEDAVARVLAGDTDVGEIAGVLAR